MSDLLPLATFNLKVSPYAPTPAIDLTTPVTVRLTLAAVDPEAVDDEDKPSTLRIIKRNPNFIDEDDEIDQILGDYDEGQLDRDEEEEEEDDEEDEDIDESEDIEDSEGEEDAFDEQKELQAEEQGQAKQLQEQEREEADEELAEQNIDAQDTHNGDDDLVATPKD